MSARRYNVGHSTQAAYAEPPGSSFDVNELVDSAVEPALVHEPDGSLIAFNHAAAQMLGLDSEQMRVMPPYGWIGMPAQTGAAARLETILHDGSLTFASIALCGDGSMLSTEVTAQRVNTLEGPLVFATFRRVTPYRSGQHLEYSGDQDELTGLPNAFAFGLILERHLERPCAEGESLLVGCLDLSGFASVHETFGHLGSGAVLVETATRLQHGVGTAGRVARTGWDDFCFFVSNVDVADTGDFAERLLAAVHEPIEFPGGCVAPDACIGFSRYCGGPIDARSLMVRADVAMHEAKQGSTRRWLVYNENMGAIEPQGE